MNLTVLDARNTQGLVIPDTCVNLTKLYASDTQGLVIPDTIIISAKIGSRSDNSVYLVLHDKMKCGCFRGTLQEFENQVHNRYELGNKHRIEYDTFIELCKSRVLELKEVTP